MQREPELAAGLAAYHVHPKHVYHLCMPTCGLNRRLAPARSATLLYSRAWAWPHRGAGWQRWHYAARAVAAGYRVLSLDADISLRADPYPLLRTLSRAHVLVRRPIVPYQHAWPCVRAFHRATRMALRPCIP